MASEARTLGISAENYLKLRIKGAKESSVRVTVAKTYQEKQYEPRTIEIVQEQIYERPFTPLEMALVSELQKAGIEYSLNVQLLSKDVITNEEFKELKTEEVKAIDALITKLNNEEPDSELVKELEEQIEELKDILK